MSKARIFQRPKTSTQSGTAHTDRWQLVFVADAPVRHDPLTGWLGYGDTQPQAVLYFPSCEAAEAYAKKRGLEYEIAPTPKRDLKVQAYADNFR